MTQSLVRIAYALLEEPDAQHWGYDLTKRSGVRSGVLYPILHGLLDRGWLADGWEDANGIVGRRPPRRYYELTDEGRRELGALLQTVGEQPRFAWLKVAGAW
jgi:PadR family transcriptional regulator PadR